MKVTEAYSDQNIHIEPRIMQDLGRADQGVLLPDGSGYLATINAFHLLHCVVRWPPQKIVTNDPADTSSSAIYT